jgi:hypothetical protein
MNFREIIWLIIIGILLAIGVFLGYKTISGNKQIKILTTENNAYKHAPTRIDTIHDSIVLPGGVVIKPIPVRVIVHDTIIRKINESFYDSIYRNNGLKFRWKSRVMGYIDEMTFSDFVIPKETVIITKSIDTCISKLPAYRPINHIGFDFDLIGNSIQKFPNFDAVFFWSIKDKIKLNIGGEYNMYHGEAYAKIGIGIYLK